MAFLKKKTCECSICKNAIYSHVYNEIYSNTESETCDVLILLEFKEIPAKMKEIISVCNTFFKNYSYKIIYALGCTPKEFKLNDSISQYQHCKEINIKKIITKLSPKVIITSGRALYSITEIKDLRPEHFYIPVNGSELSFQKDDTYIWSKEFNCKVFPIPALYRWIADSIKDVYETKFVYKQFNYVLSSLKERVRVTQQKQLVYASNPNELIQSFIDKKITAISIDTETGGFNYFRDELYSIQFAIDKNTGFFCKFKDINKELLIELFNLPNCDFIFHNSQFDLRFLKAKGIYNAKSTFDTMLAAHILNENSPNGLKPLSWIYTTVGGYDFELKQYIYKNNITSFLNLPEKLLLEYACYDAIVTFELYLYFKNRFELEDQSIKENFYNFIMPAVDMIVAVEMTGVKIDMVYFYEYLNSLKQKAYNLEQELFKILGKKINLNSNKELSTALLSLEGFEVLKDADDKPLLTKTGDLQLAKEILDQYAEKFNLPFIKKISEYNHVTKEISQLGIEFDSNNLTENKLNGKGFLASINNGRLHGGYKLHGTETGRMSGGGGLDSTVNYQNMPTPEAFRKLFLCEKDSVMAFADYDAMEVCILSQISGSGPLEDLILNNKDMHCYTAVALYKLLHPGEDITYEEIFEKTKVEGKEVKEFVKLRKDSKGLNFQCSYGATKYGLANMFNVSNEEGEKFLNAYYISYPEVKKYIEEYRLHAKKYGYVKTLLGRKRRLPELTYIGKDSFKNKKYSTFTVDNLLNAAINAPVQGTSGQTTLIAMTNIYKAFKENNMKSKILINVHDEVVFDIPLDELCESCKIIEYYMTYPYYLNVDNNKVKLSAEVKFGEVWKYGKTKQYWESHLDEWNICKNNIKERNKKLEEFYKNSVQN